MRAIAGRRFGAFLAFGEIWLEEEWASVTRVGFRVDGMKGKSNVLL